MHRRHRQHHRISIHALREEGDLRHSPRIASPHSFLSTPSARRATGPAFQQPERIDISIHALREEGDRAADMEYNYSAIFLSTPSARRATIWGRVLVVQRQDFYPHPPRGGRLLSGSYC